jgi:hypothetical protein
MASQRKVPEQAAGFVITGFEGLSTEAIRFVHRHPKQARMAVAAALEAAAVQVRLEDDDAANDIPQGLGPFVVRKSVGADMIGVSGAAERLQISRTTVYDWIDKKILLGWTSTKRGLTIPAEQIRGPGKVVQGIAEVLEIIEDPELAWAFLSTEWPFASDVARPIDKLKAGRIEEVVDAAPSFGTAFT